MTENLYNKISGNFLILRIGNVYDDSFTKKGLLKNLNKAIQNDTIFNVNKMNAVRNYIHAYDLNRIIKIIFDKNILNKTLNIGHQNISNKIMITIFEKIFNKKIRVNNLNKSHILDPNIKISPNVILKSLNYKFKKNIKSAIKFKI
jgi:nucleoside-diphosphate-sugar epimerase